MLQLFIAYCCVLTTRDAKPLTVETAEQLKEATNGPITHSCITLMLTSNYM
jgi:hypothetical protein